jgi:hypothetical protein
MGQIVDPAGRIEILDRCTDRAGFGGSCDGSSRGGRLGAVTILEVYRQRQVSGSTE